MDFGLGEDGHELQRTLQFLRKHELLRCEEALVAELTSRMESNRGEKSTLSAAVEEEAAASASFVGGAGIGIPQPAGLSTPGGEEEVEEDEEDEDSWQPSLLRRLHSMNVCGDAIKPITPAKDEADANQKRHARTPSIIEPYDLPEVATSHEEVLEHWRQSAEVACEYNGNDDEGFERFSIPRQDVNKYLVESFEGVADPIIEADEYADGHVTFSPDLKANDAHSTKPEKRTRVLDRGESFTFGDVAPGDPEDGKGTPMPTGWSDAAQNAAKNACDVFHLKVYHHASRTGFEESKDFLVKYGDVIANRYKVVEGIGRAAFSKTVRAHDLQTNTPVCLKIIKNNKDFVDQGLDEIKLLKMLNDKDPKDEHSILRMHDYFYYKEHLFIVSELLRANLYEFQQYDRETAESPYFTLSRIQCIAKQVLKSLTFLHELDLIHCDLKPENILMRSYTDCTVRLIDFGSSCFTTDRMSSYAQSRAYRAPEVILGATYSQKVDLWSLGCILAELYTGEVLFRNKSVATLLARMVSIRGPFDSELLARGADSHKYFTKEGFPFEMEEMSGALVVLRPKRTCLRRRLGECDDDFVNFLEQLLRVNPDARPTALEALEHPWIRKSLD